MQVTPAVKSRDLRLDIFRGIANWGIFLNHIPNNLMTIFTLKSYGFSDYADLFIFISGYTVALVYSRIMSERGFIAAGARLLRRAWQVYAAHIFLLAFYLTAVGAGAINYGIPPREGPWGMEYNLAIFRIKPVETLWAALTLQYKPRNMDILPIYVVYLILFPFVLWSLKRKPNLTLAASALLYFAARYFGWNIPSYGAGTWYFNPFTWQLLFVVGAWCAMGGAARMSAIIKSRAFLIGGSAYLVFALVMRAAELFPEFATMLPPELTGKFIPNDKSNLAPYRLIHFLIIAAFTARLIPKGHAMLESGWFKPAALCGQKSLEVFALGTMLSFMAHFYLQFVNGSPLSQIMVSLLGIGIMCGFAYVITHWKNFEAGNAEIKPVLTFAPKLETDLEIAARRSQRS